ncbi:hypothetical protein BMF94_4227 [Rhodotorula taiwanensis]|uniref:Uncharacterized protein n=1 Tax=Rhodotorula taiwanensis TaxID=741276 RepID=A0A2S5B7R9_9BASI|nr:hypothetical protein BMF94_4227 [Rhodotorula taiwanensis]
MAALPSQGPPHLVQCDIATTLAVTLDPTRERRPTSPRLAGTPPQSASQLDRHSASDSQGRHNGSPTPPSNVYLGETYAAQITLSVPREAAPHTAHKVNLVVEIHSGIPPLVDPAAAAPPPPSQPPPSQIRQHSITKRDYDRIEPGQAVRVPIEWELKELASHAVVCFVSYGVQVQDRETGEPTLVTRQLRKILRFEVLNPLSVRTKAHAPTPQSPTTYFSSTERCKVFLEVQVQNHCDSPMSFSRMRFDALPGFTVSDDANRGFLVGDGGGASATVRDGKADDFLHLPTGSVRQFLYILTIADPALLGSALPPGSSQGLGRLDIVWHTERGQKGHLQSATLGRRIPPASAHVIQGPGSNTAAGRQVGASPALPPLPPASSTRASASRPSPSPQRGFDHSLTPAAATSASTPRTSISSVSAAQAAGYLDPGTSLPEGCRVDVTVSDVLPAGTACRVDEPVTVRLRLAVQRPRVVRAKEPVQCAEGAKAPQQPRRVRLVAQHVQWYLSPTLRGGAHRPPLEDKSLSTPVSARRNARSTEMAIPGAMPPSGATPASQQQPGLTSLELQQRRAALLTGHRRAVSFDPSATVAGSAAEALHSGDDDDSQWRGAPRMHGVRLPKPVPDSGSPALGATGSSGPSVAVMRLGTDTVDLGWVDIPGAEGGEEKEDDRPSIETAVHFELRFVPLERGLVRFGGLRVLALPADGGAMASAAERAEDEPRDLPVAVAVWEAATIAEVWCE